MVVLLALITATFFAALQLTGSSERVASIPEFLTSALGSPQGETDATVHKPAPGVQVDVEPAGYTVHRAGASVSVTGEGSGPAGWTAFENGASRRTPFGHETITIQPDKTELYLTVVRHQGVRNWRWRLDAAGLRPRLDANGGIRFVGLRGQSAISIHPVAILDASGRDITPAGLRWSLVHDREGWWLKLRLDDSKLPLPYVIDPAANYPTPLELRNSATGVTGSWDLDSGTGTVDITTNNTPASAAVGWYAWDPALSVTTQQTTLPTTTDGKGWLVDPAGGATGFPAGTWTFTVQTDIPNATLVAGTAVLTVGVFKGTISGGVFTPTGTILTPTDDPLAQDLRSAVTPVTTNVSYTLPKFSLAAGETLFVDYWRHQTGGITAPQAARRQLDFHVNDGVAQIAHPVADDTGPTHTSFTVAEGTNPSRQYYDGTSTVYYSPAAAGDFVVTDAISDSGSGPYSVVFPAVSLDSGAFTHSVKTDTAAPFTSNTYAWTTSSTTEPGGQTITEEDLAQQQTQTTLTIKKDIAAPTGHSVTLGGAGAPYYTTLSIPLTLVDGNDGTGSGLDTSTRLVERESGDLAADACTNWSGSWSTVTLSGGADTTVASGKCYRYRYKITDNVSNQSAASADSAAAKVDTSAPTPAPSLTLSENPASANQHVSGTILFYKGGAAGGSFKVTATGMADSETAIKHLSFPSVVDLTGGGTNDTGSPYEDTYSWSNTTSGSPTGSVTATNNASVAGSGTSFTLTSDTAAPTGHSVSLAGAGTPYHGSLSVPLTLVDGGDGAGSGVDTASRVVERESGDLAADACTNWSGSWSTVTLSGGADTTVASGKCYRYRFSISDNVGNQSAVSATTPDAKVDTGDPIVSVSSPTEVTGPGAQYYDAPTKTHFFRPGGAGSFTLNATASDVETAVAGVAFPNVSAVSGWTGSTGGNDSSSPYASPADYTWTAGATAPDARTITATDKAGRTANDTVTIAADSSAPTGHSVSLAGAGAPYYTSLSVPLTLVDGSDAGSGIDTATRIVERESGDLAADGCTNWSGSWSTVTLSGGADTTVAPAKCYRYRYLISDKVGNQSAASAVSAAAKVDTSNPTAPALSVAESPADPDQYVSGTDVYYSPGASGGSFTVTATASDTETDIKHVSFPAVAGVSGGGGNDVSSPYSDTYTWTNSTAGSPTGSVTATNNASATGGGTSFGLVPDSGAPSTGDDTGSIGSGWKTSAQTVTLTPSDPGAGVATTYYTTDGSTPDTSSTQGTSIPLSADGVYTIKYFSVDRVGNAEAVQTGASQIRIDATNPSSSTLDALPAAIRNGQVLSGSSADATSGIATVAYYRCTGTSCSPSTLVGSSSTGPSYSVTWNSQPADGDYQVLARATDAAGNTLDSAKQTIKVDNSDPTGSLTSPAGGASLSGTVAVASNSADSVSGVAQVVFQRSPAGAGTWTTIDTDSSAPYSVDWVTGGVTDGDYDLRAQTTDAAGNAFTSGSVTVEVDNTAPSASVDDPGANLRGTISLTGSASDPGGSGVASLTFQRSPAGGGSWTTVDTDASSPYSVSFDTTGVSDGLYDLRAVATDVAGNTTISALVTNRRVDNTAPSASLDDPGANLHATVTLTSTASDPGGSGVAFRAYEYSPAGAGTWSATPAAFDTTGVTDGLYDLRVTVTDVAGNSTISATVVNRRVDNTAPAASLDDPGANLRATVTLSSTASDAGSGIASRVYAYSPAGAGTWTTTPAAFDTTAVADGLYDLRVTVTDNAGNSTISAVVTNRRVDNTAPSASLDDPGANLRGTVTLSSTASDPGGSGVATRTYQHSPAGAGTWTTTPAAFDTTGVTDGLYDLRVIVTDNAGNSTTSATIVNRRVDNTNPTGSVTAPAGASVVSGLTAVSSDSADAGSGVQQVIFQRSPAGAGTWTAIDSDTSAPYSVDWSTGALADGSYDLRAVTGDVAGNTHTSAIVNVLVDNNAPSVTITAPGAFVNVAAPDPFTIAATTPDTDIDTVEFFRCSNASPGCGSGSWISLGTDTTDPYEAQWNVDADGNRALRAVATDLGSNTDADTTDVTIDRTAPTGSQDDPGANLRGTVSLTGSGSDPGGTGVASLAFQRSPAGAGTWTTVDTDTSAPYSASFDTTGVTDGLYDLRVIVTDNAGNSTTSATVVNRRVDNTAPAASLDDPGANLRGTVTLTSTASDAGSGIASRVYAYSPAGAGTWTTTPAAFDTTGVTDGLYDLRVTVTDNAGNQTISATVVNRRVDNTAPSASLDDPGANLRGTVTLSSTASDAGSGIATRVYQHSPAGAGTWTTTPAAFDTTGVTDGLYDLRVIVTDNAGNSTTSATVVNRRVDNTAPAASLDDPGANLRGTVTLTSTASDAGSGIASRVYAYSPAGAGTWTTTPAAFDTTGVTDGLYDLRVTVTDNAGNQTISATVVNRRVDNTAPSASLDDPGANLRGTVTLSSTASDAGSGIATRVYQHSPAGAGTWTTTPAAFDTTGVTDGLYDLRVIVTDNAGNSTTSATVVNRRVDNTAPAASLDDPGANLRGTVTLTSTASDAGSGIASRVYAYSPAGAGTWTTTPAAFDTTGVTDGLYDLRVTVTDNAGNQTISATVVNRRVDNTAPSASLTAPADGSFVSATVAVSANSSDPGGSGVDSVLFERRPAGGGSWTAIDTDSSSPYSVSWDTNGLADGDYELRASASDQAGNSQLSALRTVTVDNTGPSASVDDPGTPLRGTVSLTGSASDPGGAGVASAAFQRSPASGGSWTTVDTDTSSPYSVSFDTTAVADGLYDFRLVATDQVGNTTVSALVTNRRVDNTAPAASLDDPGANLRATITLTSTASDAGSGVATRTYQHSPAGAGTWTTTPAAFDTTAVTDGLYDLRVIVTDNAGNSTTSAVVTNRRVDNTAPSASLDDPGANLSGTVTLTSTASDPGGSGIATRTYQHSLAGAGTWTTTPAAFDTTAVTDGLYDLRVIVTDNAGNSTTSATVVNRRVDNDAPTISLTAPSGYVNAAAPDPFTVTATSPDGDISEVEFFRCSDSSVNCGSGSWVSLGTDSAAPYSASWNVDADGARALRAVVEDEANNTGFDIVNVTIDQTAPAGGSVTYASGYDLDGSVSVATDTGTDSGSGIDLASRTLERDAIALAAGSCGVFTGTWTSVSAPDTTVASGNCYRYRHRVADNAGNVTTYTSLNVVKVDTSTPVTTDDAPAGWSSAPVLVTLAPTDTGGSGLASTEYDVDGGATQTGTAVNVAAPADGSNDGVHTISYRSTDGAGNVESWRTATVRIDASAPGLTPADPGDNLRGTVALSATATDPSSGVASVSFQSAPAGSGTWTTISTDLAAPFAASWDTTGLSDGDYDLRFVATDNAANGTATVLAGKTIDNTDPTVALTAPADGASVSGSVVPVTANAGDPGSGVASVSFMVRPAGGIYATLSTDTSSPFTAAWDSTAGADGSYELVAVAMDGAGGSTTSAVVTVTVDNDAPVVTLADPGTDLRGTVSLGSTSSGDTAQVTFERRPAGGGAWTSVGTDASVPFTTDFDTTAVADGLYELRAVALDGSGNSGTSAVRNVRVDNTTPSGSITAPAAAATVGGVVSVQASASDPGGSGVAGVTVEFRAVGAPGWTALAADTSAPYEASWNTASLSDGDYELRAGIEDIAGNASFTATVTVTVDSSAPAVTLVDPGATLSGTVELTATSPDASVVVFAYRTAGAGPWTTIATDSTAPWSATFATGSLANGTYDLRATATDSVGNSAADVRAGVLIDNSTPSGPPPDVQAPTTPPGFSGSLKNGKLTLRWGAATDGTGIAPTYALRVAGARTASYPATARQTIVNSVKAGDLRAFQIQAEDQAGNASVPSYALKVLPVVKRLTVRAAKAALVKRGFRQGKLTKKRSATVPAGRVIRAAGPTVVRVGTAVPLVVSTGGVASRSVLVLRVTSLPVLARSSHQLIRVNVDLSHAASVRTSLLDGTDELFAWRSGLGAGTTLLKLDIPNEALRQDRYTLLVAAVGPDGKTVTARVPIQIESQSTLTPTGEIEQGGSPPLGGSLYGDGDPPAPDPTTNFSPAAETSIDGGGESLTPSSPKATQSPSIVPVASPVAVKSGDSKKTVGMILLLAVLGLGSAAAVYKARSQLAFLLRGIRAGSALH